MMSPGSPQDGGDNTRNLIIAMALCLAILLGWEYFVTGPQRERLAAEQAAIEAQAPAPSQPSAPQTGEAAPTAPMTREAAIGAAPRVPIAGDWVAGSLNLQGARFDDLLLSQYRQTLESDEPVRLLSPLGAAHHMDAFFGWEPADNGEGVDAGTVWTAPAGARLAPDSPLTLTATTADGLQIQRTIAIDARYGFTVTDVVRNAGATPRQIAPYGVVRRTGLPEDFVPNQIVHQGMLGFLGPENDKTLRETRYQKAQEHARDKLRGRTLDDERILAEPSLGGWLGLSDHYWLTALLPPQTEQIQAFYDSRPENGDTNFRTFYRGETRTLAPGASVTFEQRLYAGAKRVEVLQAYERDFGVPEFDRAVDWGFLWFLTRPFFWLLDTFGGWLGNFGLAIMAATVVIKVLLFPLVNQSYEAMSRLKKLQPKMQEIQQRYAADKQRQQQEMIRLYQTEKVNPVAGCLPILLQIPIFYALYKVLTVTIEMRHAPFFGWIQDLSAPDPTSWVNLFGLLPFSADVLTSIPVLSFLFAVGLWPILYGVTMWGVTALNPPPPDPIQRQVFGLLPFVFVFLFAGFAAGLVIYWTWSNVLSIAQQYVIMRKNGVETELDKLIAKLAKRPAGAAK